MWEIFLRKSKHLTYNFSINVFNIYVLNNYKYTEIDVFKPLI